MATRTPHDPFDSVRDAFSDLGTSEKAAFVLEATFETIGQALTETGRRAATILDDLDIDSWFRAPEAEDVGAPPPPPAAPPPPVRTAPETPSEAASARKSTAQTPNPETPTTPNPASNASAPKKTAGKPGRRPPTDDET